MKIRIDLDLTPEEARAMLGLPDVAPMQARLMEETEARLREAMSLMEPDALMKSWLPLGVQGLEQFQRFFKAAVETMGAKPEKGGGAGPRR